MCAGEKFVAEAAASSRRDNCASPHHMSRVPDGFALRSPEPQAGRMEERGGTCPGKTRSPATRPLVARSCSLGARRLTFGISPAAGARYRPLRAKYSPLRFAVRSVHCRVECVVSRCKQTMISTSDRYSLVAAPNLNSRSLRFIRAKSTSPANRDAHLSIRTLLLSHANCLRRNPRGDISNASQAGSHRAPARWGGQWGWLPVVPRESSLRELSSQLAWWLARNRPANMQRRK